MSQEEVVEFVVFNELIPASTEKIYSEDSPITGHIFILILHFPAGCGGNVKAVVKISGSSTRWPMGTESFALDDITLPLEFPVPLHPIKRNDSIDVTIDNGDSAMARRPVVILGLIGRK